MSLVTLASLTGTGTEDLTGNTVLTGQLPGAVGIVQAKVGTSVTSIVVQGRLSSDYSWYTLFSTATDGDAATIALMPEMRAVITDANGLCSAAIYTA